ncbi:MAG: ABC transporter permease [Oscillospiraceae bacterium]|nr:ABC transporter permease [Oscillospiraceae bacterium]
MKRIFCKKYGSRWAAALCVMLCAATLLLYKNTAAGLESQTAAERWQAGDLHYTQVTAFISEDGAVTDEDIMSARESIESNLASLGLEAEGESARLWLDAYSGEFSLAVSTDYNEQTVRVIATDGDFFFFHPPDMESGWYYSDGNTTDATVVLDVYLAWALFGGTDVAGMTVELGGALCTVAGVASLPADERELSAYGSEYTLYAPYSLLERLDYDVPITCYEVVLPEVTSGYGLDTVETALGLSGDDYEMRTNTGRFGIINSLALLGQFSQRVQRLGRIYYPWWENAARAAENRCALLAALACALAVYPLLFIAVAGVRTAVRRKRSKGR